MASGKFSPGTLPWEAWDGSYTVSQDGETITGTGGEIRSPWINAGTLAKVDWTLTSGTFAGVQMRSSAGSPPDGTDRCIILPGDTEWDHTYKPSIGTLPSAQSWTRTVGGAGYAESFVGSDLRLETSTAYAYYTKSNPFSATDRKSVVLAEFTPNAGHQQTQHLWASFPHAATRNSWAIAIYGSGGGANSWRLGSGGFYYPSGAIVAGTKYHLRVDTWMDAGAVREALVYYRPAGSYALRDMDGWIELGGASLTTDTHRIIFGNATAANVTDVTWGEVLYWAGEEWESVTDAQTSFTRLDRGWVQLKGALNGSLTELDLLNSLTAPGDVGSISANAVGSTAAGCECAAVSGAGAYEFELRQAGGTVDSKLDLERAVGFAGVTAGTYTVRARACSPDGVRSVNYTESGSFAVPAPTPTVAISQPTTVEPGSTIQLTATLSNGATATLNGASLTSGVAVNSVTADAAPAGEVDLTFPVDPIPAGADIEMGFARINGAVLTVNGQTIAGASGTAVVGSAADAALPVVNVTHSPAQITPGQWSQVAAAGNLDQVDLQLEGQAWDGSATDAVESVNSSLIGPTADVPVIGQMPDRDRPVIRYTGGAMRIYLATTQPTTYTVQRRAYPGGTTWATDTTQPASGVITVASLTYNGATPGTSYATNHGLTLSSIYEYRLLPTYSDGSIGQPSNPIVPNDAADYEIAVSGDVPAEWYSATRTAYVRVELSHLVTIGGRDYPTGGAERYRGAIQSDGTWSISGLPRLASAARADGGDAAELRATFVFPDGSRVAKVLPNQSSATFASLTAYT